MSELYRTVGTTPEGYPLLTPVTDTPTMSFAEEYAAARSSEVREAACMAIAKRLHDDIVQPLVAKLRMRLREVDRRKQPFPVVEATQYANINTARYITEITKEHVLGAMGYTADPGDIKINMQYNRARPSTGEDTYPSITVSVRPL